MPGDLGAYKEVDLTPHRDPLLRPVLIHLLVPSDARRHARLEDCTYDRVEPPRLGQLSWRAVPVALDQPRGTLTQEKHRQTLEKLP
eukprot:5758716-Pyramimonas_sp.AAC.1